MSIPTRLYLGLTLIVVAGFYSLANWVLDDLRPRYREATEESLVDTATVLAVLLAREMPNDTLRANTFREAFAEVYRRAFSNRIYAITVTNVDLRVYVTDTNGLVVFDSRGVDEGRDYSRWNDVYLTLRGRYGARATRARANDPSSSMLYVAAPIRRAGRTVGVLTVGKPTAGANLFLSDARRKLLAAATLAGLSVIGFGLLASFWITRPIRRLTAYARDVQAGRRPRLPPLGHNEIGMMGQAMEDMRVALEGKQYVEQYVRAATHELKGPLSAIRGAAELLRERSMPEDRRERFLDHIAAESARIQALVDQLLVLSSLESRAALREPGEFDLHGLLEELAAEMAPRLQLKAVRLDLPPDRPLTAQGERFLVRQALANLLQNALDFTPREGRIEVRCTIGSDGTEIIVRDRGPGIPAYAAPHLFERFYSLPRPDTGRKSSGLGLAIVREIAVLHGGSVELGNDPQGGARAVLTLPQRPV